MNKLIWKRIAFALLVYPAIYLLKPAGDILNFFIASLLFSAILLIAAKWKHNEKERLPEWEDEESEKDDEQIKEQSRNKT